MPIRKTPLITGQYYHIFNKAIYGVQTFQDARDHKRFIETLFYYALLDKKPKYSSRKKLPNNIDYSKKLVDIICYCLMPNHFHLLLKQSSDNGIAQFIRNLCNSYTKYFNVKRKRNGPLFQGRFKAVLVETNEQLLHLSRYIHLNPLVSYIVNDLKSYPWSSYTEYTSSTNNQCEKQIILEQFS